MIKSNEDIEVENSYINENLKELLEIAKHIPNKELSRMLQQVAVPNLQAISNLLAKAYGCPYKYESETECSQLCDGYKCNFEDQSICWVLAIQYNTLCQILCTGLKYYELDESQKLLDLLKNTDDDEELYQHAEHVQEFQKFLTRRKRMDLHFKGIEEELNFNDIFPGI